MENPPFPPDKKQKQRSESTSKNVEARGCVQPQLKLHSFQGDSFLSKISEKKIQSTKLETSGKKTTANPEEIKKPEGKTLSFAAHKQKVAQQKAEEARQMEKESHTRRVEYCPTDPPAQNEMYKKLKKNLIRGAAILIIATLLGNVLLDIVSS